MTQPLFPSTISTQSPSVEFLTIKTMVRKNHQNNDHTGSSCLGGPVLGHRTVESPAIGAHRQTYAYSFTVHCHGYGGEAAATDCLQIRRQRRRHRLCFALSA